MNFLPENYTTPKTSNSYMKLQDGENKFRILSSPIIGWEDWLDKKPVRFRFNEKPLKSLDPKKPVKHFWAFVVWNHLEEKIQILHVTQATIRNSIENLCKDSDWGAPYFYDIKILKKGEGVDTEYMVNPLPHKPLDPSIKAAFMEKRCNLEAIFDNEDPFAQGYASYTEGVFEVPPVKPADKVTKEQAFELADILADCALEYQEKVWKALKLPMGSSLEPISLDVYKRVKAAALQNRAKHIMSQMKEAAEVA
jgi:hypothetical protein